MENDRIGKRGRQWNSGLPSKPSKRPYLGPDFSALPTHLPGSTTPFASTIPPHFPTSSGPPTAAVEAGLGKPSDSADKKGEGIADHQNLTQNEPLPENQPMPETSSGQPQLSNPAQSQIGRNTAETGPAGPEQQRHQPHSKSPEELAFIEGTNIVLKTDEDIAKWIAERRKNWPTRKNIEAKQSEQAQVVGNEESSGPKQKTCRFFTRNGRCKFGDNCRFAHEEGKASATQNNKQGSTARNQQQQQQGKGKQQRPSTSATRKMINGLLVEIPQRYKKEVSGTGSLYTKLVQRDLYEHENNVIIDFLQYLDAKGLIDKDTNA